jgi:hypothetical protein
MLPTHHEVYSPAPLQISVYSDDSQIGQGAGYGYVVYYGPILITKGFGLAGPKTEVYDAELMGVVEGLQATNIKTALQAYRDLNIRPHTKSSRVQEHSLPH